MTDKDKLMWLFEQVHGKITGSCYTEIITEDYKPVAVDVMKDGNLCWSASKLDLVFDYLTRHLEVIDS